ncbi:alcohol dehydrogenase [Humidesulfovibrio mexicanus]|uniref:Alcohol dehydrogenase n=1 Tax=Humidesulfovibrio mexicanus TaxID=147047 RepID=A0A238XMY0_9BACT|nr:iron-containing alcohol dehydrogenase [Humidesulfovibrio mexicanus]SNR60032.1 alcohol dehydrogenase [Humidesulfovibrio mexicanus]
MLSFAFHLPTALLFGPGKIDEIETSPHMPKGKKALIVIGQSGNILRQGYLARVQGLLGARGVKTVVFDGIRANPRTEDVDAAAEQARSMGVDFIVGLGGGSVLDSAKAIALAATKEAPFWAGFAAQVYENVCALPMVAIPTTAGTGSEANGAALICGAPGKRGFIQPGFFPTLAVVDPRLSASMPARLTAVTGMDAFFHAVECFLSTARQPMSDMLCLEAAHLVTRFLPQAVAQGDDLNARTALAWASTAAGMALALSSPISQHALEYSFSGSGRGSEHGAGLSVLSRPYFKRFLLLAQQQGQEDTLDRLSNLSVAMGFGADDQQGHPFLLALDALLEAVGLSELRAEDMGYSAEEIPAFVAAAMALKDARNFANTPVRMGEEDVRGIFEDVFK